MKYLIFLLFLLPLYCFGQSVPGCYNYVAQTPITATSNSTISGYSINCNGAATPGITIPAGVHDVHITKCKILNSTTSNGLIYINSGCYNITIDTCFFQSGYRGIYALGATNNIHIWYNFFYNIIDPNVTATSTDGGGSSVQLNNCTGTSIQILDNRSFHDVSSAGVGDQFSLYKCSGTAASPIRICRNQALNGSTNPPSTGYAGVVAGDLGGGYQRVDSNIFVNVGAVGAQVQGGHDIEMSYNTIYLAQASYTSVAIAFGNYSGLASSNITISNNSARCVQPSGSIFNFWFDPKTAFQPTGWSTNTTSTGLNANILPNPLWSACTLTVVRPNITYSPSSYTFTMGTAITSFTPTNTGSIASFTATLPPGLTINPSTGTISGTPTIGSAPANYTVTAINTAGSSTATINIGVISTDASLSSFILSNGTLSPVFCGCTSNYTASVANSVSSVTITPTVNQLNATVTVNGIPVTSGTTSGPINLVAGPNVINTVVTAQNGSTNTYSVTITRAPATDATLSSLAISGGSLSPVFSSGVISYTDTVNVASINLTPTVNQPNATVTVNGVAVPSGQSTPVNLALGVNTITTIVTAQDGITTKTYTLNITRVPSTDATLSQLTLNGGTLSPVFNNSINSYSASVGSNTGSVTLTPVANQANATVTINGVPVSSGSASNPIILAVGINTITVLTTAQDGSTTKTYAVTITRAADATLSSLGISNGTLSPSFDSNTTNYTANVASTISSITLAPVANDPNATVTVNGSPNISNPVNLVVGSNTITTVVTGQDGVTKKTYTITVTRQAAVDATLASLGISNGSLSPAFDSGTTNYTVGVDNSVATFALTPAVNDANATVTVNGLPISSGSTSNPINLIVGNNTVTVVVTAQDGTTKKTYTITVTRAKAANAITFNALAAATYGDAPITLNATSNNTDPGASITYTSDNLSVATVSGSTVMIVGAGAANITASQAATANFSAAQNVTQVLTINKADLTITAKDQHKIYGSLYIFKSTDFTTSTLVADDAVNSVTLLSDGSAALADIGTYPITPSAATGNGLTNYNITYVPGTFTVNGVTLTFAAIPDQVYGTADFDPGATSGSAISYSSSNTDVATIVNGNIHIVGVGTSTITATAVNVTQTQALKVTPAPLTITANNVNKTYGVGLTGGTPSNKFSTSGLQNGETVGSVIIDYGLGGQADASVGTYSGSVNLSGASDGTFDPDNYSITYNSGDIIVGKAALTITANNDTKVYGDAQNFAGTEFVATGLKNSDAVNAVTLTSAGAPAAAAANNYPIIPSAPVPAQGTDLSNYTIQFVNGTDAVGQALLTMTADNQSMVYGSQLPALTITYSGFVNNETSANLSHLPSVITTATAGSPTGSYPITVSGAASNNYAFSYVGGTLSVTPAPLTITAASLSKIQGSANPTLTISYSGFMNGDTKNSLTTQPTITTTADTDSPEGSYPITPGNASDPDYTINYIPGTLTINPTTLVFSAIPTQIYGASDFDPGATSLSPISYSSDNTSVATIVNGNIHIISAGSANITASAGSLTQTQPLTVSSASLTITAKDVNKTYGATLSDGSSTAFNTSGLQNGETVERVSIAYGAGADPGAGVGSYTGSVSPSAAAGGSFNPNNYNINYASGNIIVGQSNLTITPDDQSKDAGTANPALTVSYSGFVNNEDQGSLTTLPTVTTTANTNSVAGHYPITASGAVDPNYNISYVPGTLTVTGLILTFGPIPSKTYGNVDFDPGAASSSVITYSSSNTSVATIVNGNVHIVGVGSSTITANDGRTSIDQNLTVSPASLTISADNQTKTYGADNPPLTISYSGFVPGESESSLNTLPTISVNADANSIVGNYPITINGAADPNYYISYNNGSLTITRAPLKITANSLSRTYGDPNPPLTVSYDGFVNNETAISLDTQPTVTTTADINSPPANYPISASGAVDANYSMIYVPGTMTVNALALTFNPIPSQAYGSGDFNAGASGGTITYTSSNLAVATIVSGKVHIVGAGNTTITANNGSTSAQQTLTVTPIPLTITTSSATKTYGSANPALTVSYSAFANGDGPSSLSTQPTVSTTALTSSAVGTYAITASGAASPNYTISYVPGTLTVGQAALSITADSKTKVQGTANPALTVSYAGFVNGENNSALTTQPTVSTTAVTGSPIGPYPITVSGAVDANYNITYTPGTLTVTAPALAFGPLPSKTYGDANFNPGATSTNSITYTSSNLAVATIVSGNIHIVGAGTSTITANDGTSSLQQALTVNQAALTITAVNKSRTYGAANPALTVTYSAFVNGETSSVLTTQPTITTTALTGSSVGTYPITASGAAANNYAISYVAGTLTVGQAALTITAANKSKTYGATNPTLTVTYNGFVNGDTQSGLTTQPTITTTAVTGSPIGTYPITASGAVNSNYTIGYTAGTLTVGTAALTITASNQSKTYGAANPALTVNYSGFVNGDTQTSLTTQPTISTTANTGSAVGTYPITASGAVNTNYSISYSAGTLTIGQAALMITANNQTKTQGAANPALTVSYSGFVNSETNAALTTQPVITTTATTSSPVGTYPITASGAVDGNYAISYTPGTLTVTGIALSFGPIPSKVYGSADFNPGAASSSSISYTSSNTSVATIVSGNIHIVGAGTSTITANDGSTTLQQTLTVTPAALTITANSVNKTYGNTLTGGAGSTAFTSSGLVNGETIGSVTVAYGTGSAATIAVGTYSGSVTPSAATGGTFTPGNYSITYTANSIVVTPATLTITANNATKIYGNAITGSTGSTAFTSTGLVNGQTIGSVTIAYGTGSAATASAGTYTGAITPSAATGGTFTASNYTITYNSGNIIISTAALTITASNVSKTYGATLTGGNGSTAFTSSGLVSGQTIGSVTMAYGTGASATTAVGSYTGQVTPSAATGGTFTASNYTITYNKGNITVNAAALNIIANNITKAYGSTITGGTGSTAFTATGLANGQIIGSITIAYGTGSTATTAVGTYTGSVTPSAATGGTFTAGNYTITYTAGNIIVSAAALTITASNVTKTYGATLTGGSGSTAFTSSGLVNGQTIGSVTIAYGTGATATTAAGTYTGQVTPSVATGGTFTAGNYTITYAKGSITVNKAALTITANNQTKTQGAANPTLTVSYSGFVNSETNSVLTTQPTVTTTATTTSAVGTYPITASGAVAANYTISYVAGALTVTSGSTLTFNAIPSKVYGVANFSPGATTTTGTITYTSSNTSVATIVSGNIHIVAVGTSTVTASNGSTSLQQTLTVTKAALTITGAATKTYGSALTSGSGSTAFTSSGLVYSQTIGSVTMTYGTGSAATAAAGTYSGAAVPSAATGGTFIAANYTITYTSGSIVVNKATLSITATNVTKNYGTAVTGRTGSTAFTSSGLKNGQTIGTVTIAYGTGATATSKAGSYSGSVTPSAATGGTFTASNYTLSYVSGNITVSQVPLKITANNQTKIQGNANPTLTVSYSGFVNGETNSALTTQPTVTTTARTSSPVGTYPITASGAVDANYTITYVAGTLTVKSSAAALVSVVNPLHETYVPVAEPSVQQAVSPNGDGINDILQIDNIESYPDNKVTLINRNGTTIFEIAGYDNQGKVFDGHSNITKEMQKPGTYFYELQYKVNGETKRKASFFVIKY